MIYLATPSTPAIREVMRDGTIGAMLTAHSGYRAVTVEGIRWAADNGCFSQGGRFDLDVFLRWLDGMEPLRLDCLFATAPDVYDPTGAPCHDATTARSAPVLPILRDMGYKAAFVAQIGSTPDNVRWDDLDALFLGGTVPWKLSPAAEAVAYRAKREGKWLHMGRVNTLRRLRYAKAIGCDSVDGTFLKYGPDVNLPRLLNRTDTVDRQGFLFGRL